MNATAVASLPIVLLYLLALLRSWSAPEVISATPDHSAHSGATVPDPTPRRIVDLGTLPYFLPIEGSTDRLVALTQSQLDQAGGIGMESYFPALGHLPGIQMPTGPEQLMTYRADAILATKDWADMFRPFGFPRLLEIDYDPRVSMNRKLAMWDRLGGMLGKQARTRSIAVAYANRRRGLEVSLRDQPQAKVAILVGGQGYWNIAGDGYYLNDILSAVKATNVATTFLEDPEVDLEHLAVLDPPVILLNSQPRDSALPEQIYRDPNWQILRAVRDRRVYKMPRFAGFLGPVEEPLLLQWLAEVLHPALPHRLRAQYAQAYQIGYGVTPSDAEIDRMIHFDANRTSTDYLRFAAH